MLVEGEVEVELSERLSLHSKRGRKVKGVGGESGGRKEEEALK